MPESDRLQRLFLYHIWALLPFAAAWFISPRVFGVSRQPQEIHALRITLGVGMLYVAARSWIVLRREQSPYWGYVWPLADTLLISIGLCCKRLPAESWLVLAYLIPITEASATLRLRWALLIAGLAVGGYFLSSGVQGIETMRYTYGAFRLFFLLLMASLVTWLGREVSRARQEIALRDYRNELALEMHDGIQQYLAAIASRLELARGMLGGNPSEAAKMAIDQRHLARQAADELRIMVRQLRTARDADLEKMLREYCALFEERAGFPVHFRTSGEAVSVSPKVAHSVLRIVQESLTNILKHAQAREVKVELAFEPGRLTCLVADDGVGFDTSAPSDGLGLGSMTGRASEMSGTLSIESKVGQGTTVSLSIPLGSAGRTQS